MLRLVPALVLVSLLAPALSGCCCCEIFFANFARYSCRSKQAEAKGNLKALAAAEAAYFAEHARYGTLDEVGFEPRGETLRYRYVLVEATDTGFVAEAHGTDEMDGDVWRVDQDGTPKPVASVCGAGLDDDDAPRPEEGPRPAPPRDDDGVQHIAY